MADFARLICAAEPALGFPEGELLDAYWRSRQDSNALALEASTLAPAIIQLLETIEWKGTAGELLNALVQDTMNTPVDTPRLLPKTPQQLSQELRRIVPNLAEIGIVVTFSRTAGDNSTRVISIRKGGDAATHATPGEQASGKE
jgi:hypothetical protein